MAVSHTESKEKDFLDEISKLANKDFLLLEVISPTSNSRELTLSFQTGPIIGTTTCGPTQRDFVSSLKQLAKDFSFDNYLLQKPNEHQTEADLMCTTLNFFIDEVSALYN